jgi:ABC-type sugar transport system ATPase subunit
LDQGVIMQVGAPMQLYEKPANRFVAAFIGSPSMNFLPARVADVESPSRISIELAEGAGKFTLNTRGLAPAVGSSVELGIRPENATLVNVGSADAAVAGRVRLVERLGNQTLVHLDTEAGIFTLQGAGNLQVTIGDQTALQFDEHRAHVFAQDGGAL